MANLTAGNLQTIQYQAIVDLSDTLRIGIQNDLDSIVSKMFSAGIISSDERDEILDRETNESKPNRARRFMRLLQNKVRINPDCLASFRWILAEEPAHESLVNMIDNKLEELKKKSKQRAKPRQPVTDHGSDDDDGNRPEGSVPGYYS